MCLCIVSEENWFLDCRKQWAQNHYHNSIKITLILKQTVIKFKAANIWFQLVFQQNPKASLIF